MYPKTMNIDWIMIPLFVGDPISAVSEKRLNTFSTKISLEIKMNMSIIAIISFQFNFLSISTKIWTKSLDASFLSFFFANGSESAIAIISQKIKL